MAKFHYIEQKKQHELLPINFIANIHLGSNLPGRRRRMACQFQVKINFAGAHQIFKIIGHGFGQQRTSGKIVFE
ncbi:MAG: hypothetical protein JXI33_09920 [Candidatus Aminicenantes bacterium]|nr:hypothetical protein [Candidatus Aminicenantes bacterium]